jgi:hypothetical protein
MTKKNPLTEMLPIQWRFDLPDASIQTFRFNPNAGWKRKLIRGHDIAELICAEVFELDNLTLGKLHILAPAEYAGTYEIKNTFEPTFSAKRVDI